jgi:hypothetical protein
MQLSCILRCALAVALVSALALGCDTDAQVDQFQYYCDTDDECGEGFECYSPPQGQSYCVPDGTTPDAGAQDADPEPDTGGDADPPDAVADADEPDTTADADADIAGPDADVGQPDADAGAADADADPLPHDVVSLHLDGEINEITNLINAPDGDFVVTGRYTGSLDVGQDSISSRGNHDGFVLRVSPYGEVRWLRTIGSQNERLLLRDELVAAAYDADDQLLLGGSSFEGLLYGGESVLGTNPSDAKAQAYIVSAQDNGQIDWAHIFGTAGNQDDLEPDAVLGIAPLANGHTVIGGKFEGCLHELPQDLAEPCPDDASGPVDGFLIDLDDAGTETWRAVLTNDDVAQTTHTAAGTDNRVAFAAEFVDEVSLDGTPITPADSGRYRLIGELDDTGSVLWSYAPATTSNLYITAVAYGADGMLLAGAFNMDVSFGSASPSRTGFNHDGFVAQLDQSGEVDWLAQLSGTGLGLAVQSVQVDGHDRVVAALRYRGSPTFKTATLQGGNSLEAAVAVLTPDGQLVWSENFADSGRVDIWGAAAAEGRVAAIFDFDQQAEFRGSQISDSEGGTYLVLFDEPDAD